jgi:hypothetical protein
MKNLFGIFIMIFVTSIVTAQNLSNLDAKYGIKNFKLESSYDNYKSNLKLELDDGRVKYYNYVGTDVQSIFGHDIRKITLGFYKSKLYYIRLDLDDSKPVYSDLVYENLKQLFGSAERGYGIKKGPLKYDWVYVWQTQKTYLCFDKQLPNELQPGSIAIWMMSNILGNQIVIDDF